MAKRYRPVDRDQAFLLPADMREWLPADHPVWLVIRVVEDHLDTSAFHVGRRVGGAGRAGFDPVMLLTLLIWAWARGVRSSRRIERLCREDVSFRVICAGDVPDHVTIHRFRAGFAEAVTSLFTEVLVLCARLGLGRLETVALDGSKIAANASKKANRDIDGLRREAARAARQAAAEHADTDAAEDTLFGEDRRGDEVPDEVINPRTRDGRIATALAELAAEQAAAEEAARVARDEALGAQIEGRERGAPPVGRVPDEVAVQVAEQELARTINAQQAKIDAQQRRRDDAAAQGRALRERPCLPAHEHRTVLTWSKRLHKAIARLSARKAAQPAHRPVRNLTDPDSRLMPVRGGGWIQGFNGQAVTCADLLVIAADVNNNPADVGQFTPMMTAACHAANLIEQHRPDTTDTPETDPDHPDRLKHHGSGGIGILLADAGYLSTDNLTTPGPARLIALGKARDTERAARTHPTQGPPPPDTDPITTMAHRLRTPEGITTYRQRSHIAETPFGHAKHNLGFTRLSGHGLDAAQTEWTFHWAVHNLTMALTSGKLTPARLATLAT